MGSTQKNMRNLKIEPTNSKKIELLAVRKFALAPNSCLLGVEMGGIDADNHEEAKNSADIQYNSFELKTN